MKAAVKTVRPTLWSGWAAAANGQPLSHCRSRQFSQACSLGFRESVSDWPLQSPQQSRGASPTHAAASDYPSPNEIHRLFSNMAKGNYEALFDRVSADVEWTVMGTHPCAGRYRTLKDFQAGTLARLGKIMKQPGLNLAVRNVIGGGDQEWCTVELVANAECLNGIYDLAADSTRMLILQRLPV